MTEDIAKKVNQSEKPDLEELKATIRELENDLQATATPHETEGITSLHIERLDTFYQTKEESDERLTKTYPTNKRASKEIRLFAIRTIGALYKKKKLDEGITLDLKYILLGTYYNNIVRVRVQAGKELGYNCLKIWKDLLLG